MKHRISAGVIVEHDGRILMVHSVMPGRVDFWVAPGGGVQGLESLAEAEGMVEAAWLSLAELEARTVYPTFLRGRYWADREAGFPGVTHMALRPMERS